MSLVCKSIAVSALHVVFFLLFLIHLYVIEYDSVHFSVCSHFVSPQIGRAHV